jgi:hypothetical protein
MEAVNFCVCVERREKDSELLAEMTRANCAPGVTAAGKEPACAFAHSLF